MYGVGMVNKFTNGRGNGGVERAENREWSVELSAFGDNVRLKL